MEWYSIKQWVKDSNGQNVGLLIAYTTFDTNNEDVNIGFSFCDTRYDTFNKFTAEYQADERGYHLKNAKNAERVLNKVPYNQREEFMFFLQRCQRYFKDRNLPSWVEDIVGPLNRGIIYRVNRPAYYELKGKGIF